MPWGSVPWWCLLLLPLPLRPTASVGEAGAIGPKQAGLHVEKQRCVRVDCKRPDMPIEPGVLCDGRAAVLVTSSCRKGHGADARDFPLPAGSVLSNATGLGAAFRRVLANFDDEQRGMSALVKLYDSSAQEQGTGSTSSALGERGAGAQPTASARSMARELGYALRGFL